MRISSLFLSSAALLASATLGQAADLPSKKAAPVDYVKVCNINNAFTGFVIPGTDTCLKIGGFVRYQATFNETKWSNQKPGSGRAANAMTYAAVASAKFDARQTTEYGLLRSFADMRINAAGAAAIDKAYIQFAGLHAGKIQSIFDFYADDASYGSASLGSDHSAVALGYTAQFGGGMYAAISLEDATATRTGGYYGGQRAPDLIGAVGVEQSWGAVKLSGALHQLNSASTTITTSTGAVVGSPSSEYGYAVQAGVKLNVPALGASDALFLQAAYADGALSYVGLPGVNYGHLAGADFTAVSDYTYGPNGGVRKTKGWNVLAAYEHAFSPNWFANVFGGYTRYEPATVAVSSTSFVGYDAAGKAIQTRKGEVYQVGANLTWIPVKGFKVAGEVSYFAGKVDKAATVAPGLMKKTDNVVQSLIRIQRDF